MRSGVLRSAGLGSLVARLRGIELEEFEVRYRGRTARLALPGGAVISRARFDAALVDAAIQSGAHFLQETEAVVAPVRDGVRRYGSSNRDGPTNRRRGSCWSPRALASLARRRGADTRTHIAARSRIGAGCLVADAPDLYADHTIFMAVGQAGYVGMVRVEDGRLNVAAAFDPAFVRRLGTPAAAAAWHPRGSRVSNRSPHSKRLSGKVPLAWPDAHARWPRSGSFCSVMPPAMSSRSPVRGSPGLSRRRRRLRRWRCERSNEWDPRLTRTWSTRYWRLIGRRQLVCRGCAIALRQPCLTHLGFEFLQSGSRRGRGDPQTLERTSHSHTNRELTMPMLIAGIGTALPPHRIAQSDAAEIAQQFSCETPAQQRLFKGMYRRAGVETRHSVVLERSDWRTGRPADRSTAQRTPRPATGCGSMKSKPAPWRVAAGEGGLDDAATRPERVTHLVTVSCSGFDAPGFDIALSSNWACRPTSLAPTLASWAATGCSMACGWRRLSSPPTRGLRLALRGRVVQPPPPVRLELRSDRRQCSLRRRGGGPGRRDGRSASSDSAYQVVASGSTFIAGLRRRDVLADRRPWIRDDAFAARPRADRPPSGPGSTAGWRGTGSTIDAVGSWAVHPGGPRILSAFGEATGLDRATLEVSFRVLAEYGNMSSPTILFILDRLRPAERPQTVGRPGVRTGAGGRGGIAGISILATKLTLHFDRVEQSRFEPLSEVSQFTFHRERGRNNLAKSPLIPDCVIARARLGPERGKDRSPVSVYLQRRVTTAISARRKHHDRDFKEVRVYSPFRDNSSSRDSKKSSALASAYERYSRRHATTRLSSASTRRR